MNTRDLYFVASGLAHVKGLDSFSKCMSMANFTGLHRAYLESKGQRWVEQHFIKTILSVVAKHEKSFVSNED